ncbi:TonB-dependent receptor [Opitutus sp. GAS368]|uniref:TonB-dependent receptor domain-containing protein n=1 Tax=Opitutus sp. GAS368 TaxID=1882749 RepID=UPI00087A18C3|nr:TonB-dependent receptor [Opitutus sp. GAS368]SDR99686.1 TonB-dependent Receptor Plug Domain [Opitutus sp. GAS368]
MNHPHHSPRLQSAARVFGQIAAILVAFPCLMSAQTTAPVPAQGTSAKDTTGEPVYVLNAFTVTGSIKPESRLNSPLAITTIDRAKIETMAPRSIDELMKVIPGLYIESSGGEANNALAVRGIGAGSGFKYAVILEDGLPVVSEADTSFTTADNYTRVSTWIANVEGLRGGSSGVFTSNAPLATINFIGRQGAQTPDGEYKLEFGDYGLIRNDAWVSGPVNAQTTYALGGFYRVDDGLRSPGYKADKGGQLTLALNHQFKDDKGYFKITGKALNDRTAFMLPIPLTGTTADPKTIPGGPDLHTGATGSPDVRFFSFPNSPIGAINHDIADGIQVDLKYIGSELHVKLSDQLALENRNRFSSVNKSWNSNPFSTATSLQSIANSLATSGNVPASTWAAALGSDGNYRFRLTAPGQAGAVVAADATAAAALNGNGLGDLMNHWKSEAIFRDFQDDLRLIASLNDGKTTALAGLYMKTDEETRLWQWQTMLVDVSSSYRRLDLSYVDATTGQVIGQYTYNGAKQVGTTYRHGTANIDEVTPYFDLTHTQGPLILDAGARFLNFKYRGSYETARTYDLNSYAQTTANPYPALLNAQFGSGNYNNTNAAEHKVAYTVGANYTFSQNQALFARYSSGSRLSNSDIIIQASTNKNVGNVVPAHIESLTQYEFGYKYGGQHLAAFLTFFYARQRDVPNTGFQLVNGTPVPVSFTTGLNNVGVELDTTWNPVRHLSIDVRGTVQQPKIVTPGLVNIAGTLTSLDGLNPTRTPKVYGSVTGTYTFDETSIGRPAVNLGIAYTGSRPTNQNANPNAIPLSAFTEVTAGFSLAFHHSLTFRLEVSNLLDSAGLTEGDPRAPSGNAGAYFNARPILPRSIVSSLTYSF